MGWKPADFEVVAHGKGFDGIFGREDWKAVLSGCVIGSDMRDALGLPGALFFLFTGPRGVGKTALARAFAAETGYRLFSFRMEDFLEEVPEKTGEKISALCRELSGGEPFFLLIEEVDCGRADETAVPLAQALTDLGKEGFPMICVMTVREEEAVPSPLRGLVVACRLGEPVREERAACFQGMLEGIVKCRAGFGWEQMADETEGFSFTDCRAASLFVKGLLVEKGMRTYNSMEALQEAFKSGALRLTPEMFSKAAAMARPWQKDRGVPGYSFGGQMEGATFGGQAGTGLAGQMEGASFGGQAGAGFAPQAGPAFAGGGTGHPPAETGKRPDGGGKPAGDLNYDDILIDDIFGADSEMNPANL